MQTAIKCLDVRKYVVSRPFGDGWFRLNVCLCKVSEVPSLRGRMVPSVNAIIGFLTSPVPSGTDGSTDTPLSVKIVMVPSLWGRMVLIGG